MQGGVLNAILAKSMNQSESVIKKQIVVRQMDRSMWVEGCDRRAQDRAKLPTECWG